MATIDFNTVPSGVTLNEERVQYLSDRAAETATAFSRKIEKLQATVLEARDRYSREADELIASATSEDRAAARLVARDGPVALLVRGRELHGGDPRVAAREGPRADLRLPHRELDRPGVALARADAAPQEVDARQGVAPTRRPLS